MYYNKKGLPFQYTTHNLVYIIIEILYEMIKFLNIYFDKLCINLKFKTIQERYVLIQLFIANQLHATILHIAS